MDCSERKQYGDTFSSLQLSGTATPILHRSSKEKIIKNKIILPNHSF
jgi:hypothetical protein